MSAAVILFVVGGLALFFAYLGHKAWSDRPLASGILLVLLAGIGWLVLGLGGNVIALIGALFVFLAGVLMLIEPARHAVSAAVTS
jgi:CHASE2 domain-containing sensor protein